MNKWAKRTAIGLLVVALLAALTVVAGKYLGERKMQRKIAVQVEAIAIPADATRIERGRYLFSTRGCADCHGADGAGKEVFNTRKMHVYSPNISKGANSVTTGYRSQDWVRTLRHGVKPDGTPVMIMPSEDYSRLTDADVGALVAYINQLPPAPGRAALVQLPVAVKVMYAFGLVRDAAEIIDHTLPPSQPVEAAVSVEHGAYIAQSCIGCHGAYLSGGRVPGAPLEWPAPANLTPGSGSAMTRYRSPEAFMAMFRTGKRPDGTAISPVMPFPSLGQLTDVDVRALHAYLLTLPPRTAGSR